jgi:peptide/nickel transport system substrate-binding protein
VTSHLYEPLFTLDERYGVIPMLAGGHTVADSGKTWTIRLRRGVPFHNGKECSAEDVVASITRWGRIASVGKVLYKNVQSMQAKDRYTVELRFAGCSGAVLSALANASQFPAIYPKEVVEAAGDGQIKDSVGTGPFRFVERVPDRHVRMARFDRYATRSEARPGTAGGARHTWTSCTSSRCRTCRCARPASSRASTTSATGSRPTITSASPATPGST